MDYNSRFDQLVDMWSNHIKNKIVILHDDDTAVMKKIERLYPMSKFSGIAWEKIPGSHSVYIDHMRSGNTMIFPVGFIEGVFDQFIDMSGLSDDSICILLEDSSDNRMISASVSMIRLALPVIMAWPQDIYVISQDFSWCYCSDMSGWVHWGKGK